MTSRNDSVRCDCRRVLVWHGHPVGGALWSRLLCPACDPPCRVCVKE